MTMHAERAFFEELLPTGNQRAKRRHLSGSTIAYNASPRAIVNCFQAILNPSCQIDFPVALVISHYLYTISGLSVCLSVNMIGVVT